jgi:hypothetical protein
MNAAALINKPQGRYHGLIGIPGTGGPPVTGIWLRWGREYTRVAGSAWLAAANQDGGALRGGVAAKRAGQDGPLPSSRIAGHDTS